jgi:drug/metabolite transporter (DMT)-like permease
MSTISWLILIGSILAISIGDVFIKKAGVSSQSFAAMFKNPWFIGAALLYVVQVIGFGYLMFSGAKLSWIGIVQTILYALVVIGSGVLLFHESISLIQGVGIALAITGLVLLNL